MNNNLTESTKEVWDYIKLFYKNNGYVPNLIEVSIATNRSVWSVERAFKKLVEKQYIKKSALPRGRYIIITTK